MEASTDDATAGQTEEASLNKQVARPSAAVLFTAFGIGKSYLFYVGKDIQQVSQQQIQACWKEVFKDCQGWEFTQLDEYDKPLGETVTFVLSAESCPEGTALIEDLRKVYATSLFAEIDSKRIEVVYFTTGVAVLVLHLTAKEPGDQLFFDRLQDKEALKEAREKLKEIIKLCRKCYLTVLDEAEQHKCKSTASPQWVLYRFKQVDRKGWEPKQKFSYPLFFVDANTYQERIEKILEQVAGLPAQRNRQSDEARVSYKGMEIYVDWSEALVNSQTVSNQKLIENNFIIALASWLALVLMNKNTSIFLLEAFLGMVTDSAQGTTDAVHQRDMAYKDVADAALPIRWTTQRRDLFLLETIHHNWSSERWRRNIDERMKLLAMHYQRLEAQHRERFSRRLAVGGLWLTAFVLVSVIADLVNLLDAPSHRLVLGHPLKQVGAYSIGLLALIGILIVVVFSLRSKLRSRGNSGKSIGRY